MEARDFSRVRLHDELTKLGLNDKERDDFITFWLPKLSENEYCLISFDLEEYTDMTKVSIEPSPDSMIRVYMTYKGLSSPVIIEEPEEITTPKREGFTVVEWGGSEID